MAGISQSFERILAKAVKGPAKKRAAESSPPQQEPVDNPQAVAEATPGSTRPASKKKRAKGGEVDKRAVGPEGVDHSKRSTQREEPPRRAIPAWLERLSDAAYDDPFQASQEICRHAFERAKEAAALRKEKGEASGRVKELEKALKEANEKAASSDKELRLAKEELNSAEERLKELDGLTEKVSKLQGEVDGLAENVKQLTEDKAYLEEDAERLRSELDETTADAMSTLEDSFTNAIQQVEFCHPGLSIDRSIVHHHHTVLGDVLVHPRGRPDGTSRVIRRRGEP